MVWAATEQGSVSGGFRCGFNLRELGTDFVGATNDGCRAECKGLCDHVMKVLLDNKQLFGNRVQFAQSLLDLFYTNHFTQIGVHHEHATGATGRLVPQ